MTLRRALPCWIDRPDDVARSSNDESPCARIINLPNVPALPPWPSRPAGTPVRGRPRSPRDFRKLVAKRSVAAS